MKELSIEEKAERYDEAIERAKNFIENGDESERTIAESIFAGIMEESEDEKIRQLLLRFVEYDMPDYYSDEFSKEDCLAWLEKEAKGNEREIPNFTWSEEDKKNRKDVIGLLEGWMSTFKETCYAQDCKRGILWLKSLRPQNWTKEDKERYISCLQRLSTGNPEQPETINSKWFEEHVYPQSQWKPSDEQMKALWDSIPENVKEISEREMLLDSLYQDLKKLKV